MSKIYKTWGDLKTLLKSDLDYVILDTETTGLDNRSQIVQLAVIDNTGKTLIDTLVKPTIEIPQRATDIHGITNKMCDYAPVWGEIRYSLHHCVTGRNVIVYNAPFDLKMMHQMDFSIGFSYSDWQDKGLFFCAMHSYAERFGEWDSYHNSYRWVKLTEALTALGGKPKNVHSALGDCLMTLQLCELLSKVD